MGLMQSARRLLVWVMVALWLPATLHCAMDQAGVFDSKPACCHEDSSKAADANDCGTRCDIVGGDTQKLANHLVKVPAPVLLVWLSNAVVSLPDELAFAPQVSPDGAESPPELSRTWQFVERAALPPRAPSLAS